MEDFTNNHHDHGMESPDMNSLSGDEVGVDERCDQHPHHRTTVPGHDLRRDGALQLMALQHNSAAHSTNDANNTTSLAHSNTASLDMLASALEARVTAVSAAVHGREHGDDHSFDDGDGESPGSRDEEKTDGEENNEASDDEDMEENPVDLDEQEDDEEPGEEDEIEEEAKDLVESAQEEEGVDLEEIEGGGQGGNDMEHRGEEEPAKIGEEEEIEGEETAMDGVQQELINGNFYDEVQVVEKTPVVVDEATLERRRRRRKLRRMLKNAGKFPSFVALITAPTAVGDDDNEEVEEEEDDNSTPECIYIDVDDCLSLKKRKPVSSSSTNNVAPQLISSTNRPIRQARITTSKKKEKSNDVTTPAEEGYYEGVVPLAMAEDEKYVSPIQQLIRKHLELFSATAEDAGSTQSGRRAPVVRGKVGVRCIHCAKVTREATTESASSPAAMEPDHAKSSAPSSASTKDAHKIAGAVSYPLNIAGVYTCCTQKPQLHFENCPNMPPSVKAQFFRLKHDNSKDGEGRFRNKGVSAAIYYVVSAKRLGLIDVEGGIRFARDLSLEPLPLEAVLAKESQKSDGGRTYSAAIEMPAAVGSAGSPQPRIGADPESEKVLAEAVAEADDPEKYLARAEDKNHVTDFLFLALRQMAICHAVPADFATRGKKTKKMRVGFTGFCCRHCSKERERQDGSALAWAHSTSGVNDYSCRSFSSAADNLASSISNSFVLHLQKCSNTPRRVKSALAAYKRLHQRQMAQLVYGSQRRLFHELWARLREADVPEEKMMERIEEFRHVTPTPKNAVVAGLINDNANLPIDSTGVASVGAQDGRKQSVDTTSSEPNERGPEFPSSNDAETETILKAAEVNWDTATNDGLILPSDRHLVSDYLFLTLRQVKLAIPADTDVLKGRRGSSGTYPAVAGICCMHCEKEDQTLISPSGRSFPSAPDNYASALNTSLYNHMQNCHNIPVDLKRSLANLRKIHSQQCSKLKFGSQRRFFNILFDRVRKIPVPEFPDLPFAPTSATKGRRKSTDNNNNDEYNLTRFGFFEAPLQTYLCTRCRMVPLPFRARGSLCFARPALDFIRDHHNICKDSGFDLWFAAESLELVVKEHFRSNLSLVTHDLFKEVVMEAFAGNESLTDIFTEGIAKYIRASRSGGQRAAAVSRAMQRKTRGLWSAFPNSVDGAKVAHAFVSFASIVQGLSPQLQDHVSIVNYFLLISPSINFPKEDDDEELLNDDESARKRHKTDRDDEGFEDDKEDYEEVALDDDSEGIGNEDGNDAGDGDEEVAGDQEMDEDLKA